MRMLSCARLSRLMVLGGCAGALAGCAGIDMGRYTGEDRAYIVMMTSLATSNATGQVTFSYTTQANGCNGPDANSWGAIYYNSVLERNDYKSGTEIGTVQVESVKPGKYVICTVTSHSGQFTATQRKPIALPFEARAQQTTYLGRFAAHYIPATYHSILFGDYTAPGGVYFGVSDWEEEDVGYARSHRPEIPAATINDTPTEMQMRLIRPTIYFPIDQLPSVQH